MKKKICILYTGGTIGMQCTDKSLEPSQKFKDLLAERITTSKYDTKLTFDIYSFEPLIDSSRANQVHWKSIANTIVNSYNNYDGFLILHGTDTMAYTASILSFILNPLTKPVIITGSQFPTLNPTTDGWQNIFNALECVIQPLITEVCIFFNGILFRGNRCTKIDSSSYSAFDSPNYPPLGKCYNSQLQLYPELLLSNTSNRKISVFCHTEPLVHIVHIYPGIHESIIEKTLELHHKAIILLTLGSGNMPTLSDRVLKKIAHFNTSGKLIVNLTQCYIGITDQSIYATGSILANYGIYDLGDATLEAIFCKLHYLYSTYDNLDKIVSSLKSPLAGEISVYTP